MKIYCASDLHIGHEQANYDKIKEFFELVEEKADELILCGDVFDLWRCTIEKVRDDNFLDGKPKKAYEALISTARKVPTTIIFGNHDYKLWKELSIPVRVTDDFVYDGIYFCHGWRFSLEQRLSSFAFRGIVQNFPSIYQNFFRTPSQIKDKEDEYTKVCEMTHRVAKSFMKRNKDRNIKYLVMGHTHGPFPDGNRKIANDPFEEGKLFDCGDMIDSLSYVIIDNGEPKLEKMKRN